MKSIIAAAILLGVSLSISAKDGPAPGSNIYRPAQFADPTRREKARVVFPEIERAYREHAISNKFPGLSFGVVLDGKLVFSGNYGVADIAKKNPVTADTLFRIASMSKSVTAVAILQLRDKGKLNLDEPVSKYLPEMKKIKYLTADSPEITVRDLLSHSGGFPEDNPWGDWQLEDKEEDLIKLVRDGLTFSNPPGISYEYSNLGFALLGRIVTQVSGMPYQRYIDKNIFAPLQMPATEWEYTKVPANLLAHGYRYEDDQWKEESLQHDGAYGAMGGLISSVNEFSRYIGMHLDGWPPRDGEDRSPLKRSSLREMHQPSRISGFFPEAKLDGTNCPVVSAYGCGLGWSRDCRNVAGVGHSGGLPGFGSHWRILPDYGIGVVAFANKTYANVAAPNAKAINLLLKAGLQPRELPVSAILQQRKEELASYLPNWAGAQNNHVFAENFFKDFALETRRKTARDVFTKAGKIIQTGELKPLNNLRGTFVLHGEIGNVEVSFTLTPENPPLIQELNLRPIPRK